MFFQTKLPDTPRCYAHLIGGCSNKMSKEHVFTQAVMAKVGMIGMTGYPNRPDSTIGISSAVSKILCRAHNSELSVLDNEAKKLSDALIDFSTGKSPGIVHLDGAKFERWLLKVTLGYLAAGHTCLGRLYPRVPDVIHALYGHIPLGSPIGMYSLVEVGSWPEHPREILFRELVATDPAGQARCVGAFISLHRVPFLFWFGGPFPIRDYLLKPDGSSYLDPYDCTTASTRFHPTATRLSCDGVPDLVMNFAWPLCTNGSAGATLWSVARKFVG